jgi:methionyl-tRNA synthetase
MTNSASTPSRYYLTTPIYYVNARPHLGHAYSTIVCDAIARRKRAQGIDTWFLTGTDEHGQKIERSAELAGRTPEEFATAISGEFRGLWKQLGITNDDFIRTTEERHKRGTQKFFATLRDKGFIYKGSYSGQYCVSDELYVDGPVGAICPDCGRVTETVSEENYFFKLSAFEHKLLEFYDANPDFMGPESTRREVISFVRGGLKDLSVSRTSFSWGIPVPGDEKHVIYVWLDALVNYITALGYGSDDPVDQARFAKFWPANMHLIGKEISRFHCVYWPAFLMAAGLPLPRSVRANGWLLFDQGKMSKSRGNIVRAETVQQVLGADALRYFLLREIPFGQDGNFSFGALVQRFNGDLANGYGNLVSRVVNMVHKYFGGVLPNDEILSTTIRPLNYQNMEPEPEQALRSSIPGSIEEYWRYFDNFEFSDALKTFSFLVAVVDQYLTANAPWKKPAGRSETDHKLLQARVLATAAEAIRIITALVYPILPESSAKVWRQLGLGEIAEAARHSFLKNLAWGGLKAGTKFGEPSPLFPRVEKDVIEQMQKIEEQNTKTVVEAAASGAAKAASSTKSKTANSASETTEKRAIVNENSEKQASLNSAPVDSLGADSKAETKGYETLARAANASAVAAASAPAVPAAQTPAPPQVVAEPQYISIDDVIKVDLRVAQILVAERIPKADKLLRLEVDLGYEKRQILAGIAQYYEPEKLIGRKIVVVVNLAPRKMRGLMSNGMLLAASLEGGSPVLAGFLEDVPLGARLK